MGENQKEAKSSKERVSDGRSLGAELSHLGHRRVREECVKEDLGAVREERPLIRACLKALRQDELESGEEAGVVGKSDGGAR